MTHFDAATAAVQAALDAGARYADARVMHRRTESMSARNGEIEELSQDETAGIGVRALVGSGWGFYAVPDLSDAGRPRGRHAAPRRSPRRARRVPGPAVDLVPRARRDRLAGPRPARSTRCRCRCPTRAICWSTSPRRCADSGADLGRGHLPDLGHRASGSSPARGTASTSASASAAAGIVAHRDRRRRDPAARPTRPPGQYGTRGWELVTELDLPGNAARIGRGVARAADRAAVPVRRDHADPRQRADGAADPRVGRPRDRARPDPRLGGRVRRHVLARPRPARLAALRLRADEHHHRPDHPGRAGQLRLRRRGHPGRQARRRPRRASGSACWPAATRPPWPGLDYARQRARRRLGPAADGADDQRRPGARAAHARRDHRRHRRRGLHGHQPLLVDRRPPAQLPVRLRDRLRDQERQARPDAAQPDLHRDRAAVLAVDGHARPRRSPRGARRTAARVSPGRSGTPVIRRPRRGSPNVRVGVRG